MRCFASFIITNANSFFNAAYEDLSVANASGTCGRAYRINRLFLHFVENNHLDFDLGKKVDRVFATAVELGMALLTAVSARFTVERMADRYLDLYRSLLG